VVGNLGENRAGEVEEREEEEEEKPRRHVGWSLEARLAADCLCIVLLDLDLLGCLPCSRQHLY
jgi:hypothetical protein